MYTAVIADDEIWIRKWLEQVLSNYDKEIRVAASLDDGLKVKEFLEKEEADILISDIRMPGMTGLELARWLREQGRTTKVMIISGYSDFEYAKEAVHLEIEEYILKPLTAAEITKVFEELKKKLDQEINEKKGAELLKRYYKDSLPLLQANFYSTLIEGRVPEEELGKYIMNYEIDFTGPWYACIIIHTSTTQVPKDIDVQLLAISVDRQAGERLEEKWRGKRFNYLGDTVMIVQLESKEEVSELTDSCDRFCKYVNHMIGAVVTVGVGQVCDNILELVKSYQSAREAVSYRVLYGSNQAINLKEIVPKRKVATEAADGTELAYLFKMICLGKNPDVKSAVERYMEHKIVPTKSLEKYHVAVMELISEMYHFMVNNELDGQKLSGGAGQLYTLLSNMEPQVLEKWLLNLCLALHEDMANARDHSKRSLIDQAKEYVHNNYQEESLGLDDICKELGVSNSYFSSIFKKETGKSFVGYLTGYRMEKAARMLVETNEKSYMIAKNVGYTDPNYFSYVFKRQYGVSPSTYRTEYENI